MLHHFKMILGFGNTTVALSGTSSTTTAFAPTLTLLPIETPGNIFAPAPINTLFSIFTPPVQL